MKDDAKLSITFADLRTLAFAYANRRMVIITNVILPGGRIDFTIGGIPYRLYGDVAEAFWALGIGQHPTQEEDR